MFVFSETGFHVDHLRGSCQDRQPSGQDFYRGVGRLGLASHSTPFLSRVLVKWRLRRLLRLPHLRLVLRQSEHQWCPQRFPVAGMTVFLMEESSGFEPHPVSRATRFPTGASFACLVYSPCETHSRRSRS